MSAKNPGSKDLGPLPRSDRNAELQEHSVRAINDLLPVEKFVFREETKIDAGVDGTIEIKQSGFYTGMRSYVQVKSCEQPRRVKEDGSIAHSIETRNLNYLLNTPCPLYMLYDLRNKELWYTWAWDEVNRIEGVMPAWRKQKSVTLLFKKKLNRRTIHDVHRRIRSETTINRAARTILSRAGAPETATILADKKTHRVIEPSPEQVREMLRSSLSPRALTAGQKEPVGLHAGQHRPKASSRAKRKVVILSLDSRQALGMMVTSPIPLPMGLFKKLFPETNWAQHYRLLTKHGLVKNNAGRLYPSREAKKVILSDKAESGRLAEVWIKKFESLKEYPDIVLYLATHYMSAGRLEDAVQVLSDIANSGVYGRTNETYLRLLELIAQERVIQKLRPRARVRMFHALAVCLTEAGNYEKAIEWFDRVHRESLRIKDRYWLGQYYVNSGIAHYYSGDLAKAAAACQKAIKHGEKTGDETLISNALGNLAQVKLSQDEPDAAIVLLKRSIAAKRRGRDRFGMATAYAQMGTIEAKRGNHRVAITHFRRAETMFAQFEAAHDLAKTHFNLGKAYAALGQHGKACGSYKKAIRVAEAEGELDLRLLATQGFAESCHVLKRFADIEEAFQKILDSTDAAKHGESRISAYFGIGVAQRSRGLGEDGRGNLKRALHLARKLNEPTWVFKSLVALASPMDQGALPSPSLARLIRLALREQKCENWKVAAKLWELTVGYYTEPGSLDEVEASFASVGLCTEKSGANPEAQLSVLLKLYAWERRANLYPQAIETLQRAEELAATHKLVSEQAQVIDERGTCCHWLERRDEAVALHKRAVRLARKHSLPSQLRISLNNLGETLRQVGKTKQSVAAFAESERLSRSAGDLVNAIATGINRALAIEESGDRPRAAALFNRCCLEAKKGRYWRENARSLKCLAELAWSQRRPDVAGDRYRAALSVAKRHGLVDLQTEIAVNYASLLKQTGESGKALKMLSEYEGNIGHHRASYINYEVMADLCLKCGDVCRARTNWELGKAAALASGNHDHVAICAARLAELFEEEHKFDLAAIELETAIKHEHDSKGQAMLLIQLLRVQLQAGDSKKAAQTFNAARTLADAHGLVSAMVDIHIIASDFAWKEGNRESRVNALIGYLAAIVYGVLHQASDYVSNAGYHIVGRLTRESLAVALNDFESMFEEARKCLPAKLLSAQTIMPLVLWPFEVVRKVLPFVGDKSRFPAELKRAVKTARLRLRRGELKP